MKPSARCDAFLCELFEKAAYCPDGISSTTPSDSNALEIHDMELERSKGGTMRTADTSHSRGDEAVQRHPVLRFPTPAVLGLRFFAIFTCFQDEHVYQHRLDDGDTV